MWKNYTVFLKILDAQIFHDAPIVDNHFPGLVRMFK